MDINMVASTAQGANDSVGMALLKKTISSEAQIAQILIDSISQTVTRAPNLPANLGQNINTSA